MTTNPLINLLWHDASAPAPQPSPSSSQSGDTDIPLLDTDDNIQLTSPPENAPVLHDHTVRDDSIRYPVVSLSMSAGHEWSKHTPQSAIRLMSELLETLTSHSLPDSEVLMVRLKPFVIKNSVSNTEFKHLFRKVHAVWERTDEHISTHQLHQFYRLVVGEAHTHVPYITIVHGTRVSWFVNRPGTDEWTSVLHNVEKADNAEQFARSFLYPNHHCQHESPNNNQRPVALRTANRSDLDNIINAANVLGPRHKTTKRIVRQWIIDLVRQYPLNKRGSDRLDAIFDQIDNAPTS